MNLKCGTEIVIGLSNAKNYINEWEANNPHFEIVDFDIKRLTGSSFLVTIKYHTLVGTQ